MKTTQANFKFFFIVNILTIIYLTPLCAAAQSQELQSKIVSSLEKGDAQALSELFNTTIDLSLPGYEGAYSKKQAAQILKMYFSKNPVKSYTHEHTGSSNSGSSYLIGTYKSQAGKVFNVYILIKLRDSEQKIQQLQFEEE